MNFWKFGLQLNFYTRANLNARYLIVIILLNEGLWIVCLYYELLEIRRTKFSFLSETDPISSPIRFGQIWDIRPILPDPIWYPAKNLVSRRIGYRIGQKLALLPALSSPEKDPEQWFTTWKWCFLNWKSFHVWTGYGHSFSRYYNLYFRGDVLREYFVDSWEECTLATPFLRGVYPGNPSLERSAPWQPFSREECTLATLLSRGVYPGNPSLERSVPWQPFSREECTLATLLSRGVHPGNPSLERSVPWQPFSRFKKNTFVDQNKTSAAARGVYHGNPSLVSRIILLSTRKRLALLRIYCLRW